MYWSRFNFLFEDGGQYFLYNSLSNSFAELNKETYFTLYSYIPGKENTLKDKELSKELCRMRAFVEDDTDEFLKLKYLASWRKFSKKQLQLTINPTLDCNFSCPYCFENSHPKSYMNDDVENDVVEFIKEHKESKELSVSWFGGEPLLAFNRIISLTSKMLKLDMAYEARMITNGYLMDKKVIERLEDLRIRSIQITIDGLQCIHDSRRYLKKGRGATFNTIIENIRLLLTTCPTIHLNIRMNIDKTNAKDFIDAYNFFHFDDLLSKASFTPAFVDDIYGTNKCIFNNREQFAYIKELFDKYGIVFSDFYPYLRTECSVRNFNSVVIGPDGELYKCWNDVGKKERIYGYLNGTITNEKILLRYLEASDPYEDAKCKDCLLLPVCAGGGCPYQRIKRDYEDKTINICPLMKENLKSFLISHYKSKN